MKNLLVSFVAVLSLAGSAVAAGQDGLRIEPDVVYGHKAGLALTFDAYRPPDPNGAAVVFVNSGGFRSPDFSRQCVAEDGDLWGTGGGSWRLRASAEMEPPVLRQVSFEKLLAAGFTVFDVRHGSAPQFKLDEMVADCRRAVRAIQRDADRFGIAPSRIGVWGCSAGGYLAGYLAFAGADDAAGNAAAATSAAVQAAVLYYPTGYDLNEFPFLIQNLEALQLPADVLDSLSLKNFVSSDDPPTLLIWGDADREFITEPAGDIHAALTVAGATTGRIVYEGIAHTWKDGEGRYHAATGERALDAAVDWFGEHLQAR